MFHICYLLIASIAEIKNYMGIHFVNNDDCDYHITEQDGEPKISVAVFGPSGLRLSSVLESFSVSVES